MEDEGTDKMYKVGGGSQQKEALIVGGVRDGSIIQRSVMGTELWSIFMHIKF